MNYEIVKHYFQLSTVLVLTGLVVVLVAGAWLRFEYYGTVPFPGESRDEYSNTWVGMSLIQSGMPIGFSGIDGYENQLYAYINVDDVFQMIDNGTPFAINWPWFDHPPLLGLMTGGYISLIGIDNFSETNIRIIRRPMVVMGVVSIGLVFAFASVVYDKYVGLVASLIYAVSPLVITGSRMVQAENLLLPWMLATLVMWMWYEKLGREWMLWLVAILAGMSMLVKLSGVSVVLMIAVLLLSRGTISKQEKLRELVVFIPVSMSWLLVFVVYGMALDWQQFVSTFLSNSHRIYGIGAGAVHNMMVVNKVTNTKFLTDAWVLGGWLSVAGLLAVAKEHKYVVVPLMSYLMVLLLFGSHPFGWYRFPMWPFLYMAIGYWVVAGWRDWSRYLGVLVLFVVVGMSLSQVVGLEQLLVYLSWWKLACLVVLAGILGVFVHGESHDRAMQWGVRVVLIGLLISSGVLSMLYAHQLGPEQWFFVN